jgi:hypothetical protein
MSGLTNSLDSLVLPSIESFGHLQNHLLSPRSEQVIHRVLSWFPIFKGPLDGDDDRRCEQGEELKVLSQTRC